MRKGTKHTEKTKEKMSLAGKNRPSNYKGKKMSLESREKISKTKRANFLKENPNYKYISNPRHDRKWVRRERIKQFGGFHSVGEWENLKAQYNWTCPSCKKSEPEIKLTRDHIIAISKGGSDNIENIQPLCNPCNAQKSTTTIRY